MTCCNQDCNQGRTCPQRVSPTRTIVEWTIDLLAAWGLLTAIIAVSCLVGYYQ